MIRVTRRQVRTVLTRANFAAVKFNHNGVASSGFGLAEPIGYIKVRYYYGTKAQRSLWGVDYSAREVGFAKDYLLALLSAGIQASLSLDDGRTVIVPVEQEGS